MDERPLSVETDELRGDLSRVFPGLGDGLLPFGPAQPVDLRLDVSWIEVLLNPVELIGGDEELVTGRIFKEQKLLLDSVHRPLGETVIASDTELDVNDKVARFEVEQGRNRTSFEEPLLGESETRDAKQFCVGYNRDLVLRQRETTCEVAL